MFGQLFKRNTNTAICDKENLLSESYSYSSENAKDMLFEQNLEQLRMKYRMGQIPKINAAERKILEFCHERDMIEFLREEFDKHPIKLDENGNLIGGNPFDREREMNRAIGVNTVPQAIKDTSNYEII